jgi:hydroxyacylglutathione hydrolase
VNIERHQGYRILLRLLRGSRLLSAADWLSIISFFVELKAAFMTILQVEPVPCLRDNYAWLVYDRGEGICAAVDPSEAEPVGRALAARDLRLTHILNTHHHMDHVGGNLELKAQSGAQIIGPGKDRARIPGIDIGLVERETYALGSHVAKIFEIPAHTRGHIAFWFENDAMVFTGDTLFAMGCGRLFEGDPPTMWQSLSKLMALPDNTKVYCGHEYTEANGRFALTVEPGNADLTTRMAEVRSIRAKGRPTLPSTIGLEKKTNPFLRTRSAELRRTLGLEAANDVEVFAETRRRKDNF